MTAVLKHPGGESSEQAEGSPVILTKMVGSAIHDTKRPDILAANANWGPCVGLDLEPIDHQRTFCKTRVMRSVFYDKDFWSLYGVCAKRH